MKIAILTLGSRGDVEPYLALALGLQTIGHKVVMAAPAAYHDWICSFGVECFPIRFDPHKSDIERDRQYKRNLRNAWRRGRSAVRTFRAGMELTFEDYEIATRDADLILQTGIAYGGMEIGENRGTPVAFAYAFPVFPTRNFPSFMMRWQGSFGGAYNRFTQYAAWRVMWATVRNTVNRWRGQCGLPGWRSYKDMYGSRPRSGAPSFYAYSQHVLAKPDDWPSTEHVVGNWPLPPPSGWTPPSDLLDFLEGGEPPVFVGFGSMFVNDPEAKTKEVLRALEISGRRGVLFTGGGRALTRVEASPDVLYVDSVPHGWLFPRMAAVVHHGGAGTTASGIRAGVPTIIAPADYDQFAWAKHLGNLGIGLSAGSLRSLKASRLAKAISRAVTDKEMRAAAKTMGDKVRAEDGIGNAIAIIERFIELHGAQHGAQHGEPRPTSSSVYGHTGALLANSDC